MPGCVSLVTTVVVAAVVVAVVGAGAVVAAAVVARSKLIEVVVAAMVFVVAVVAAVLVAAVVATSMVESGLIAVVVAAVVVAAVVVAAVVVAAVVVAAVFATTLGVQPRLVAVLVVIKHVSKSMASVVLATVPNWRFGSGSGLESNWNSCNGFYHIKKPNRTKPAVFWAIPDFRKHRSLAPIKYLSCDHITI